MSSQWESERSQLLSMGRDDLVTNVEQLVDVGIATGSYAEGTAAYTHARRIGEDINSVGGFRMMREMHKLVVSALLAKTSHENAALLSRRLESAWHGIGSWLG